MMNRPDPKAIIATLALMPHPEGGWYRETFRNKLPDGGRGVLTQIYYLLRRGERSRWHRIDAFEVWHFYAGDPLALQVAEADDTAHTLVLGTTFAEGHVATPSCRREPGNPRSRWANIHSSAAR